MFPLEKIIRFFGGLLRVERKKNETGDAIQTTPKKEHPLTKGSPDFDYLQNILRFKSTPLQKSTTDKIAQNKVYWAAFREKNRQKQPAKFQPRKKGPSDTSFPEPSRRQIMAWKIANDRYHDTPEWEFLRNIVLERAKHNCEICHRRPADSVHRKIFPPIMEELIFREPKMNELVALCPECARERYKPSDWSDPHHPWYPDNDTAK